MAGKFAQAAKTFRDTNTKSTNLKNKISETFVSFVVFVVFVVSKFRGFDK